MVFREIGNYSMRSIFIEKYQNGLLRVGEVGGARLACGGGWNVVVSGVVLLARRGVVAIVRQLLASGWRWVSRSDTWSLHQWTT